jgi:hypothetical protein
MTETTQETAPFDAEGMVWEYRFAHDRGDTARAEQVRKEWAAWQGDDSLHEMAFGEPIDPAAIRARVRRTKREMILLNALRDGLEAELA